MEKDCQYVRQEMSCSPASNTNLQRLELNALCKGFDQGWLNEEVLEDRSGLESWRWEGQAAVLEGLRTLLENGVYDMT